MKSLFSKELCNTGRQIEFDIAKAVCILGMVFVHCFEQLTAPVTEETASYYIMTIVLDALFGAATFMGSMGLGVAYSIKDDDGASALMKRGVLIFILGHVLSFVRYGLPDLIFFGIGEDFSLKRFLATDIFANDIMPFAGMALFLLGLLKRIKLSDKLIFAVALIMSIAGSFARFVPVGDPLISEFGGLIFGTYYEEYILASGTFPLLNWFIFVVAGYLYGKALRHCKDKHKYYSISLPVSAVIIAIYLVVAIPNELGMMNPNIFYYYQLTTIDAAFCFIGMIFVTSLYHFVSLTFGDKVKKAIQKISSNINSTYCIHWVIIGWIDTILMAQGDTFALSSVQVFVFGCVLYIVSNILAEIYAEFKRKRKALKHS